MTDNDGPSSSDGHDDDEKDEDTIPDQLQQVRYVVEVLLLLRRVVDWLIL
jgi:hypothetical protein